MGEVVRDAVRSEPVSSLISLFCMEFTGKTQFLMHSEGQARLQFLQNFATFERNFLPAEQGIHPGRTGN